MGRAKLSDPPAHVPGRDTADERSRYISNVWLISGGVSCVSPALVDLKSEILSGFLLEGSRVVFPLPLLESLRVVRIDATPVL